MQLVWLLVPLLFGMFLLAVFAAGVMLLTRGKWEELIQKLAGKGELATARKNPQWAVVARPSLLTPTELAFFHSLQAACQGRIHICSCVRLVDLVVTRQNMPWAARNRLDRKHVDFVLCDPATMRILHVIELDDHSHMRADRQEADEVKNGVLSAAGIPLTRIRPAGRYDFSFLESVGRGR